MTPTEVALSVVICTKDRADDVLLALDSIRAQTRAPDIVLIVDGSSDDRVKDAVLAWQKEKAFAALTYVRSAPGLTHQRNVGAERARGDIVCYLDDDVLLDPRYFEEVLRKFEDPAVYGVSGLDLEAGLGGIWGRIFRRLLMLPRMDGKGTMLPSGFPSWCIFPNREIPVEILRGHNMSYRRKVFEDLRFNEDFEGYGLMEDVEFSYRVSRRYRMVMIPSAKLRHRKSPTARERSEAIFRMRTVNHWRIYRGFVHRGFWTRLCYLWANLGVLIWSLLTDVRKGGTGAFKGYLEGIKDIRKAGTR
jgi:glycosyltransferase involved in cell wall biosynthesis